MGICLRRNSHRIFFNNWTCKSELSNSVAGTELCVHSSIHLSWNPRQACAPCFAWLDESFNFEDSYIYNTLDKHLLGTKVSHTHTHTHTTGRVFFWLRVRCVAFLRDRGFPEKTYVVMLFYRRHRVFLYKTYEYLHFSRRSRFFLKNSHNECRKKNMPGHVLRELHRFLERNKNTQNKITVTEKHTQNQKTRAAKKTTLTPVLLAIIQAALCALSLRRESTASTDASASAALQAWVR